MNLSGWCHRQSAVLGLRYFEFFNTYKGMLTVVTAVLVGRVSHKRLNLFSNFAGLAEGYKIQLKSLASLTTL